MKTIRIKNIEFLNEDNHFIRQIKVTLSNDSIITIEACHESWEQWGGTEEELYVTMPIAEKHNDWLHGMERQ